MQYPPPCAFTKITQEPEIIKSETYKIQSDPLEEKEISESEKIQELYDIIQHLNNKVRIYK